MNATLPDKPSALIRLALEDLRKCEKLPEKYIINMCVFMAKDSELLCTVCLAGATLIQEFDGNRDIPEDENNKIWSLDSFRCGLIRRGVKRFYGVSEDSPQFREIENFRVFSDYNRGKEEWYSEMRKIADYLEREGY